MREKHPIDDRFKEALYHAEAEPPTSLKNAVMARLDASEGPRTIGGVWPTAVLVLGLVGAGTAIWSWNDPGEPEVQQLANHGSGPVALPANSVGINHTASEVDAGLEANTTTLQAVAAQRSIDHDESHARIGSEHANVLTMNNAGSDPGQLLTNNLPGPRPTSRSVRSDANALHRSRQGSSAVNSERPAANVRAEKMAEGSVHPVRVSLGQAAVAPLTDDALVLDAGSGSSFGFSNTSADHLTPLPIAFNEPDLGSPEVPSSSPAYVLPDGVWWMGASIGIGTVQGQWKGADLEALDQAEDWQSTGQAGIQLGRAWRSGWSVSTGLGLSMVRSRLDYNTTGPSSSFLDVDTTWSEYAHTSSGVSLYTWVIDSMMVARPGAPSRVDSRNRYTAVQVPLNVHWYGDLRRFRLGAFGGVMAWIPTQRQGLTLAGPVQDGNPSTVALQDPRVNERFVTQLHGQAGFSVGYWITEHFSAYVEPLISTPILSFGGGETPWLTRPTLQIRIQHELRYRPH